MKKSLKNDGMKIIASTRTDQVWLRVGELTWKLLRASRKDEFLRALDQIAEIRSDIGRDAYVQTMPPVEVVAEIWADDQLMIDGKMTILQYQELNLFGARLPAPTALCGNEDLLRRVLVHEFAHCFEMLIKVVRAMQSNQSGMVDKFDPFSEAADTERLGRPSDWFGARDISELLLHDDAGLNEEITQKAIDLRPYLRWAMPDKGYAASAIAIADDVKSRAMELLRRNEN